MSYWTKQRKRKRLEQQHQKLKDIAADKAIKKSFADIIEHVKGGNHELS